MWNDAHDAYLESRILSADPVELIALLYQSCISSVREARVHLAEGRIAERSCAITRAHAIVVELMSSLDFTRGGELSGRLAGLYDYMGGRLLEANQQQADGPLAEVVGLLLTLAEGWAGVQRELAPAVPAATPWAQPAGDEPPAGHAWTL